MRGKQSIDELHPLPKLLLKRMTSFHLKRHHRRPVLGSLCQLDTSSYPDRHYILNANLASNPITVYWVKAVSRMWEKLESPISYAEHRIFLCLFRALPVRGDYQNHWVNIEGEDSHGSSLIRKEYWTLWVGERISHEDIELWKISIQLSIILGKQWELNKHNCNLLRESWTHKEEKVQNLLHLDVKHPTNSYMKGSVPSLTHLRMTEPSI